MTHRAIECALSCFHQIEKLFYQSKIYIIPLPEFLHLSHYQVGFIDFASSVENNFIAYEEDIKKNKALQTCGDSFKFTNSNKPKERRKHATI